MRGKRIISIAMITILMLSLLPVVQSGQGSESPIEEGPIWEKDYGDDESIRIYPASENEFFLIQEEQLELLNQNGKKKWSKTFPNNVNMVPTLKDDRVYVQTGPLSGNRYRLRGLDSDNGTEIWNETIDDASYILVNDDHEIFLPHRSGNITKISSKGKTKWTKNYTMDSRHLGGAFLNDDQIVVLYHQRESKDEICSISSDGDLNWKLDIEGNVGIMQKNKEATGLYFSTRNEIYEVNSQGEKDLVYDTNPENHLGVFRSKGDRIYLVQESDDDNNTFLKSVNKKGELQWNVSIENVNKEGFGDIFISVPGNERIYCQYWNITKDPRYPYQNFYKINAFNLEGEEEWEHDYENETIHSYHHISKDGVIMTSTAEGKVYAYQGHEPTSNGLPGFTSTLVLPAAVIAIAGYKKKKE